jgi:hypothetical protein
MTDFTKLRAYLKRITEVAEEDSNSVVSLGIIPAVREAIQELDRLEQERDRALYTNRVQDLSLSKTSLLE